MENIVRVAKRLIPTEEIALVEPFVFESNSPLRTARDLKSRIVLLDKTSILFERPPEEIAESNGFRFIVADCVATNPAIRFWVETFEPARAFTPSRPFQSRLLWRDQNGQVQSKLLTATAETVLAVAVRGERDPEAPALDAIPRAVRPRHGARSATVTGAPGTAP